MATYGETPVAMVMPWNTSDAIPGTTDSPPQRYPLPTKLPAAESTLKGYTFTFHQGELVKIIYYSQISSWTFHFYF